MMTPMGLHNMSDVQQYRKLVEMRNQDIMNKREDEVLRQYQHVTQDIKDDGKGRFMTAAGQAKAELAVPQLRAANPLAPTSMATLKQDHPAI